MQIDLLIQQARMFSMIALDGLNGADTLALILDPTLYREYLYSGKGEPIKRILQAAIDFERETLAAAQELIELEQKKGGKG